MSFITFCLIFSGAIGIGVLAVIMGGTLFLSFPLFQILFPDMSLAAIVGNIKFGSILRNAAALIPNRSTIDYKVLWIAPLLCLGSLIGSWQVIAVSPIIIPVVLLLGLIVTEYGHKLKLPPYLWWIATFIVGVYGGIFGAGIMLLILALLRLKTSTTVDARTNALLLELLVSAVGVVTFWYFNLINWPIALTWAFGGMIGGYIGGHIIKSTGKWPQETQDWLIRGAFFIALVVAIVKLL
jgi:uncharacterized protein